jgi:hypothetical protein
MSGWFTRRLRGLAVIGLIVLGVARMGADEAAAALAELEGGGPYTCEREEYADVAEMNVGHDIDYYCVEVDGGRYPRAFLVGTDGGRITDRTPLG